jgi:hypothetical protein
MTRVWKLYLLQQTEGTTNNSTSLQKASSPAKRILFFNILHQTHNLLVKQRFNSRHSFVSRKSTYTSRSDLPPLTSTDFLPGYPLATHKHLLYDSRESLTSITPTASPHKALQQQRISLSHISREPHISSKPDFTDNNAPFAGLSFWSKKTPSPDSSKPATPVDPNQEPGYILPPTDVECIRCRNKPKLMHECSGGRTCPQCEKHRKSFRECECLVLNGFRARGPCNNCEAEGRTATQCAYEVGGELDKVGYRDKFWLKLGYGHRNPKTENV